MAHPNNVCDAATPTKATPTMLNPRAECVDEPTRPAIDNSVNAVFSSVLATTPMKDMIGGTQSRELDPYFHDTLFLKTKDGLEKKHVRFKALPNCDTNCTVLELSPLLRLDTVKHKLCWENENAPTKTLHLILSRLNLPTHFYPSFHRDFSCPLEGADNRGRRPKPMADLVLGKRGYCGAKQKTCCATEFVFGFTIDEAKKLYAILSEGMLEQNQSTRIKLSFRQVAPLVGDDSPGCVHQQGIGYGRLQGPRRMEVGQQMHSMKQAPSQLQRNLATTHRDTNHCNHSLVPSRKVLRNAKHEAKMQEIFDYGLCLYPTTLFPT